MRLTHGASALGSRWLTLAALCAVTSRPSASSARAAPDIMVLLDRVGHSASDYGASFRPVIARE